MRLQHCVPIALLLACTVGVAPAHAVTPGQSDTFAGGVLAGWSNGPNNSLPPLNVASGGPAGAGDAYLLMRSTGTAGAGSRLVAISGPQWGGDYLAAGVAAISMDLNNLGATDLSLRLLVEGAGASAISTTAFALQSQTGWVRATFALTPDALTGSDPAAVLASVVQLRVYHSSAAAFPGPAIAASLGIDNVTAVPEPGVPAMLAAGLALLAVAAHRRAAR
jgi:hypothetical protein